MFMAFPGTGDRTTEIVAHDVFLEALDEPDLILQIQAQHPSDLDSALRVAQYMEAVMKSLPGRPSKPVRMVVQSGTDSKIDTELRDLRVGQRFLLDSIQQLAERRTMSGGGAPCNGVAGGPTSGGPASGGPTSGNESPGWRRMEEPRGTRGRPGGRSHQRPPEGDGPRQPPRNTECFRCGRRDILLRIVACLGRDVARRRSLHLTCIPTFRPRPCRITIASTQKGRSPDECI